MSRPCMHADEMKSSASLDEWIEREFAGLGVAVRQEDEAPIPGEPLMSMAKAKELVRKAVTMATPPDMGGIGESHG